MMLKHKKSIISVSGRPTAKINPFLESSFRGYFTITDAVFVEVTNVGQKTGEVHGRINLFFKRNKRQIAGFHIAFQSKNKVSLNLKICAFLVFTFYEFREKFQVMELNEGAILSTLHCAGALEIWKMLKIHVEIMVTLPRFDKSVKLEKKIARKLKNLLLSVVPSEGPECPKSRCKNKPESGKNLGLIRQSKN